MIFQTHGYVMLLFFESDMFLPLETTNKLSESYTSSSIRVYDNVIRRLYREHFPNKTEFDPDDLLDLSDYLDSKTPKDGKRILAVVIAVLKCYELYPDVIECYRRRSKSLAAGARNQRKYAAEKDLDNYMTLEELIDLRKKSKPGTRRHLLLSLYTKMPPLRGEEWCNAELQASDDNNYLDQDGWFLVVRNYKTSKQYGERRIPISTGLRKDLERYLAEMKLPRTGYLFPGDCGGLSPQAFHDAWCRITRPQKVSTSMLRKVYISEILRYVKKNENETRASQICDDLSWLMGHSISTQEFTYNRLKDVKCSSDNVLRDVYDNLCDVLRRL